MTPTEKQQTDLYSAVWRKNLPEVQALLDAGANPHHIYTNGRNLAHVAAWFNKAEILALLIEKSIDLGRTDEFGKTPLLLAIENASFSSFKLLAKSSLLTQSLAPSSEAVKTPSKIPHHPALTPTHLDLTPLHLIVRAGRLEWLDWLDKQKIITNWVVVKPDHRYTLAHEAVRSEQLKIIPWLYSRGIDPNQDSSPFPSVNDALQKIPGGQKFIKKPKDQPSKENPEDQLAPGSLLKSSP